MRPRKIVMRPIRVAEVGKTFADPAPLRPRRGGWLRRLLSVFRRRG